MTKAGIKDLLDEKLEEYNQPGFIESDPIVIPHMFHKKQDIEIAGFWTSILAWGKRKIIINKATELVRMMDFSPYEFILNHSAEDLRPFQTFRHRTFNGDDALYFISFFRYFYSNHDTLEDAFLVGMDASKTLVTGINGFYNLFFSLEHLDRTRKHISCPDRNSACKRINMFLRWMVRNDGKGVDFGIWNRLQPSQLICPCDVHVSRVARMLGLISRKQTDWKAAEELTGNLRLFDPTDPVKYDYALFSMGLEATEVTFD